MARKKVGALTTYQNNLIKGVIQTLRSRVEHHMDRSYLTHMDILNMFVHEEHRVVLIKACELVTDRTRAVVNRTFETKWKVITERYDTRDLRISLNDAPFLMPSYMGSGVVQQVPEAQEKINKWISWYVQHDTEFKLLEAAVNDLALYCDTVHQMRFYFKGLVTLLRDETLAAVPTPKKLPDVPVELRRTLVDMNTLLAKVALYPTDEKRSEGEQVSLRLDMLRFRKPWKPYNTWEVWV